MRDKWYLLVAVLVPVTFILVNPVAAQFSATPRKICCSTTTEVVFDSDCATSWELTVGDSNPIIISEPSVSRSVTCPEEQCPVTIEVRFETKQSPPGVKCPPSGQTGIECVKCNQSGEIALNTGIPLETVVASPQSTSLDIDTFNVATYAEEISVLGCDPVSPQLIDLQANITFDDHPDPEFISFNILSMEQSLAPFEICGVNTGKNNSTLLLSEPAGGVINISDGTITGSAVVLHSNRLSGDLPFEVPNFISGVWQPGSQEVFLTFSGPAAAPSILQIPTLGTTAIILLMVLVALSTILILRYVK